MYIRIARNLFFALCCIFTTPCLAQESWPSPEIAAAYRQAQAYMAVNNLHDAITAYKQLIKLAPDKMILYRDLGNAYYQDGRYADAEQVLAPLANAHTADQICYQVMGGAQVAQGYKKAAVATLQEGLQRYPAAGMLYHEMGNVAYTAKEPQRALKWWLDGIRQEPAYALNYYDAAKTYLSSRKVIWGLLYGELYLDLSMDTAGSQALKKQIYMAWGTLFENMVQEVPEYGAKAGSAKQADFESAISSELQKLAPVVADGYSEEHLTMLRTRFLINWYAAGNDRKYPFSLFTYQDALIRNGLFDVYNEWLYGKAENEAQYDAWNKFHAGAADTLAAWQASHKFMPTISGFYNNRQMDGLFIKKKKG